MILGMSVGVFTTLHVIISLLANVQSSKGLGILSDGDSGPRRQVNYLVQGAFQATPKIKLGLNWGESRLRDERARE